MSVSKGTCQIATPVLPAVPVYVHPVVYWEPPPHVPSEVVDTLNG